MEQKKPYNYKNKPDYEPEIPKQEPEEEQLPIVVNAGIKGKVILVAESYFVVSTDQFGNAWKLKDVKNNKVKVGDIISL